MPGMHLAAGSCRPPAPFWRELKSCSCHGWYGTSPGFISAAMFCRYLPFICQIPPSSGFPSGPRGAGAVRFGRPSGVRGIPGVVTLNHCADAGSAASSTDAIMIRPSMRLLLLGDHMLDVLFVLRADEFEQLGIHQQRGCFRHRPGLGVRARMVVVFSDFHVPEILARD